MGVLAWLLLVGARSSCDDPGAPCGLRGLALSLLFSTCRPSAYRTSVSGNFADPCGAGRGGDGMSRVYRIRS